MAVIQTKGLTKFYKQTVGIKDLTLAVSEGEIFGYLGPNGALHVCFRRCFSLFYAIYFCYFYRQDIAA